MVVLGITNMDRKPTEKRGRDAQCVEQEKEAGDFFVSQTVALPDLPPRENVRELGTLLVRDEERKTSGSPTSQDLRGNAAPGDERTDKEVAVNDDARNV